jgi:hypothetical protein
MRRLLNRRLLNRRLLNRRLLNKRLLKSLTKGLIELCDYIALKTCYNYNNNYICAIKYNSTKTTSLRGIYELNQKNRVFYLFPDLLWGRGCILDLFYLVC